MVLQRRVSSPCTMPEHLHSLSTTVFKNEESPPGVWGSAKLNGESLVISQVTWTVKGRDAISTVLLTRYEISALCSTSIMPTEKAQKSLHRFTATLAPIQCSRLAYVSLEH
mmetsp:Transcript_7501/g.14202  ORF Transcript_7501/g.14202 Transcript_7501/m.14202 type:complete len:111 (-) Transcript_7501:58-390(-)